MYAPLKRDGNVLLDQRVPDVIDHVVNVLELAEEAELAYRVGRGQARTRVGLSGAEHGDNRGLAAVERIIGTPTAPRTADQAPAPGEPTRFFRFPGFVSTPKLLDELNARNMVIFGACMTLIRRSPWAASMNMNTWMSFRNASPRLTPPLFPGAFGYPPNPGMA